MAQRLLNKVAIVSGSTYGIGFAIVEKFLKEGAKVCVNSSKLKNVNDAMEKLKDKFHSNNIIGTVCDVTSDSDRKNLIQETVKNFGKIDILVTNAAYGNPLPIMECTEEEWDKTFNVNLKSSLMLIKESVNHFKKNGSIILNSSIMGYAPARNVSSYSISKAAIFCMVKVLSQELANSSLEIRVNAIAPGIIKTDFSAPLWVKGPYHDHFMENFHLKRFGTPEDCANLVSFLASDESSYITGETIVIAGGYPTRL